MPVYQSSYKSVLRDAGAEDAFCVPVPDMVELPIPALAKLRRVFCVEVDDVRFEADLDVVESEKLVEDTGPVLIFGIGVTGASPWSCVSWL